MRLMKYTNFAKIVQVHVVKDHGPISLRPQSGTRHFSDTTFSFLRFNT